MENKENTQETQSVENVETTPSGVPSKVESKRDGFIGKMKTKYPDKTYDDDEEVYKDALEYLSEMEATTQEAENFKRDLLSVLEENPIISVLIKRTKEMDGDFMAALQTLVEKPSDLMLQKGEEGYDRATKYISDRAKMDLQQEEIRKQWQANSEKLPSVIQSWADKNGIDEENLSKFLDFVTSFSSRVVVGDIDEKVLDQMYKSYTYDEKINEVSEDNTIAKSNSAPAKKEVPSMPMPENSAPQPKTKMERTKDTSFEDAFGLS